MAKTLEESVNVLHNLFLSKPDLTTGDANTLKKLFQVLENNAKIEIFNTLVSATDKSAIVNFLDEMLYKYQDILTELKAKESTDEVASEIQKYEVLVNYVRSMKNAYVNKDWKELTYSFFGNDTKSENALKMDCLGSLATGYYAFNSLYGEFILEDGSQRKMDPYTPSVTEVTNDAKINSNYLDSVFEILLDAEKMEIFRLYFRLKNAGRLVIVVDRDKIRMEAYDEIANNFMHVKRISEIIGKYHSLQNSVKDKQMDADTKYFDVQGEDYSSKSALWKLVHKDKVNKAAEYKELVAQISALNEEINSLEAELDSLSENLSTDTKNLIRSALNPVIKGGDGEEKNFYEDLRSIIVNDDEEKAKQKLEQRKNSLSEVTAKNEELLANRQDRLNALMSDMPNELKDQLSKDEHGIESIVLLDQRNTRYNRSPIVCAYVLKVLSDARGISPEDMLNSLGKIELSDLESEYQDYIDTYLSDTLGQVKQDVTVQEKSL